MTKKYLLNLTFLLALTIFSCSRKTHPNRSTSPTIEYNYPPIENKSESPPPANKPTLNRRSITSNATKEPIPKVIIVNDSAAHKSVDGRYYYDVMGHRYWRNKKDGKYYLFNKSMYSDPAFK